MVVLNKIYLLKNSEIQGLIHKGFILMSQGCCIHCQMQNTCSNCTGLTIITYMDYTTYNCVQ